MTNKCLIKIEHLEIINKALRKIGKYYLTTENGLFTFDMQVYEKGLLQIDKNVWECALELIKNNFQDIRNVSIDDLHEILNNPYIVENYIENKEAYGE